jgi:hypothetical protein
MKKLLFSLLAVLCLGIVSTATASDDDVVTLRASIRGTNEVPPINTDATGSFKATIQSDGTITFTETFANLSSNLVVSHIHFAPKHVAGGVMIFLCGGDTQPACPAATSGTITGTISAANVVGPAGQGITAGDLASALRAINQNLGYVNLHTTKFPGGEIRGQVSVRHDDDE